MVRALILILALPASLWAAATIHFDGPGAALAAPFLVAAWIALLAPRSRVLGTGLFVALLAVVSVWWLSLEASNDREWLPEVARTASAEIDGDRVTIRNVRNFDYRSADDFSERWETRRYDSSQLVGADLYLCYWGSPWIAHTIVSWEFRDAPPLAVSIETRKEVGESYSAVLGFFRQFELYYVVADERDVVRLRTNFRGDECQLYRTTTPPAEARAVLLDYLAEINRLSEQPRWYNAATHNCTTSIRHHVQHVGAGNPWDWRILVNGRLDELGYERGTIDDGIPFAELRERSYINERAQAAGDARDFSARIRDGLPPRHGAASAAEGTE